MTDAEIFHKLVSEKVKEELYFEFEGFNCHDTDMGVECYGWDGESRRCDCGNRRVSWVLSDCKTYVYGVAY